MARYWVYLNEQVAGPFDLEQLIRTPGFSRRTLVCVDDYSGKPGQWISPADIPELARIFRVAEELHERPVASPPPRPAAKPQRPRMPTHLTPVAPPVEESKSHTAAWLAFLFLAAAAIAGGVFRWTQLEQKRVGEEETRNVKSFVESYTLPSSSQYSNLRQFFDEKKLTPHWELERTPTGVYDTAVTAETQPRDQPVPLYAFEVNLQSQSMRGVNSAGMKLLSEGFIPTPVKTAKAAPSAAPQHSMVDLFPSALNDRRQAFEQGDFGAVWSSFSQRQKNELEHGGIGETGYVRMQSLTRRLAPPVTQTILKTKKDDDKSMWVLLRQAEDKHPDLLIKQHWVVEDNQWKLDNEEKHSAPSPGTAATEESTPATPASASSPNSETRPSENQDQAASPPSVSDSSSMEGAAKPAPSKSAVMSLPGIAPSN